jgi:lysyl-tRNA synthetase class 1
MPLFYSQLGDEIKPYYPFDFSTLVSLLQIPHIDIKQEVAKRTAESLSEFDWQIANQRIASAQKWLQDYADEEDKLVIYLEQVPDKARDLTQEEVSYLEKLLENLQNILVWESDMLQTTLFATSKELQIQQPIAFKAVYLSFLGKERGPKAGALLSYLDKSFVLARLREVIHLNMASVK